jgi:FADH2 O2-dependent halogenase
MGHTVTLVERGAHPRFAIGESSTPLAAICLERLAARYDLPDLHSLAAYGRWMEHMPDLRRGLKRGFTFYGHRANASYENDDANASRLLVAASPNDSVADAHWFREDVDHFLVQRAVAEGVDYLDRTDLTELLPTPSGYHLLGSRGDKSVSLDVDLVVDASGASGFLARHLGIPSHFDKIRLRTGLVYGHFEGVVPFQDVATSSGALFPPGPYPDERAAVHHLLPDGWMYQLPFDHGVVSAGFVIEHNDTWPELRRLPPDTAFARLLARYPTLGEQFASARPTRPLAVIGRLQRRLAAATGSRWALLPHAFTFLSPLFSTGIAWSLLGVERLAWLLEPLAENPTTTDLNAQLTRYGALLADEACHLEQLIEGAYAVRGNFDLFAAYSYLYFVAASYAEASQRLLPPPSESGSWCLQGFLGTSDPVIRGAIARTRAQLHATPSSGRTPAFAELFLNEIRDLLRPRNVAGLADPARHRMYPVDLDALVEGAALLGLTSAEIQDKFPHLRGGT